MRIKEEHLPVVIGLSVAAIFIALIYSPPDPRFSKPNGGITALHEVYSPRQAAEINALIAGGADVNAQDNNGTAPLHIAAAYNQRWFAEKLLLSGGNVNIKTSAGQTPLDVALHRQYTGLAAFLESKGAKRGGLWSKIWIVILQLLVPHTSIL